MRTGSLVVMRVVAVDSDDVLRRAREVAEHRRGGRGDERRVVVLAGGEDVEAGLVGVLGDREDGADALGVVRGAAGRGVGGDVADGEDPELHLAPHRSMRLHVLAPQRGTFDPYSLSRVRPGSQRTTVGAPGASEARHRASRYRDRRAGQASRARHRSAAPLRRWCVTEQLRVLVVEDEPDAAEYVRTVLTRRGGMDVVVVHDPISALAEVDRTVFDAVVTDIELPGMTGLELLAELRARRPGLPVVVMTAHASVDYAVEALRRDADEFLIKPVAGRDPRRRASTRLAPRGPRAARQQRHRRGRARDRRAPRRRRDRRSAARSPRTAPPATRSSSSRSPAGRAAAPATTAATSRSPPPSCSARACSCEDLEDTRHRHRPRAVAIIERVVARGGSPRSSTRTPRTTGTRTTAPCTRPSTSPTRRGRVRRLLPEPVVHDRLPAHPVRARSTASPTPSSPCSPPSRSQAASATTCSPTSSWRPRATGRASAAAARRAARDDPGRPRCPAPPRAAQVGTTRRRPRADSAPTGRTMTTTEPTGCS